VPKKPFTRRTVLAATGAALAWALAAPAGAQTAFPDKPLKIIAPYSAGGIADILSRLVAERLSARYGQPVVVENKPGAGGHLGGELVARATPDGTTMVLATIAHNGASAMYKGLKYDPATDLVPVALVAESAGVLIVNPTLPVKTLPEFLALAKASPGKLDYASAGNGSAIHMATELFKHLSGTSLVHVPYKGSAPAMAALLGGQVHLMFENLVTALPQIQAGKVRAIAVTSRVRHPSLPDVPTIAEAGLPGYAAEPWYTLSVPRGVPPAVMRQLNTDINEVLKAPDLAPRWSAMGVTPLGGSLDDALARNAAERERWTRVIQAAQITVN